MAAQETDHEQAHRIVCERHLLAEEKWIIHTMNMIREQINALRVEGLALQSHKLEVRAEYIKNLSKYVDAETIHPNTEEMLANLQELSEPLQQPATEPPALSAEEYELEPDIEESNIDDFNLIEETCNDQELNLNVAPAESQRKNWDIEDQEYESDDEEEWSKVNLDMDMLVGGSLE